MASHDIIGKIETTQNKYGNLEDVAAGGLVGFLNNLVSLIITLAGIFFIINFLSAGYQYLSANGEPQKITAAGNKILQSLIGLMVVAAAFIIAGIIGFIVFGDQSALISPVLNKLIP